MAPLSTMISHCTRKGQANQILRIGKMQLIELSELALGLHSAQLRETALQECIVHSSRRQRVLDSGLGLHSVQFHTIEICRDELPSGISMEFYRSFQNQALLILSKLQIQAFLYMQTLSVLLKTLQRSLGARSTIHSCRRSFLRT